MLDDKQRLAALRADLGDALQRHPPREKVAYLTGWVVVYEMMDESGEKWLCRADSENSTVWQRQGMLHNALYEGLWEPEELDD